MSVDSVVRFNSRQPWMKNKNGKAANGPRHCHPQPLRVLKTGLPCSSQLEPENDASVVPEVALVVVASRKGIAEAGQHKIKLRWPDGD